MNSVKRRMLPAVVAGALGWGGAFASAAQPTQQELMAQLEELKAKVAALETNQRQISTQAVDETVERVLRDADRRSRLLAVEGFTAGYDKGKFLIQSADGNFVLNPNLQFQFRSVTNYREEIEDDGDDDIEHGFEVRRMKLGFDGNVFSKDLKYGIVWATDRADGDLVLEDAFVRYQFAEKWAIKGGQYKIPVHHEELTSSKRQLAADRSLLNELLGGGMTDRSQGVSLIYEPIDKLTIEGMIHDGANEDNTNFEDDDFNFGGGGRAEYIVFGDSKQYADFSAMNNKEDLLVIGGGGDFSQIGDTNQLAHTVDAQWENTAGLGLYAAYVAMYTDPGAAGETTYDWGVLLQAGYMLTDKWEVFARYDYTDLDTDDDQDQLHEITGGVNYYFFGHSAKMTLDVTYLPEGAPRDTGIGFLASDEDQFVLRGQFQLLL